MDLSRFVALTCFFGLFLHQPLEESQAPKATPPKIMRFALEGQRTCVAFSPDGKTLATGGQDNYIRLWDVASGKLRRAFKAHHAPAGVFRLAYFPDGRMLASGGSWGDGTVKLWEVASGAQRQVIGKNMGGITFTAVSPDGKLLAWSAGGGKISIFDVRANHEARTLVIRLAVDSVAFSPDSKLLASANGDGTVRLWDVATGKTVRDIKAAQSTATGSQAVAFSHDGQIIATASQKKVKLWKVSTGEELAALGPGGEYSFCVAISPDGRFLAAGTNETLRVYNWATRKEFFCWHEPINSVAFSPDGRCLAFGSRAFNGGAGLIDLGESRK